MLSATTITDFEIKEDTNGEWQFANPNYWVRLMLIDCHDPEVQSVNSQVHMAEDFKRYFEKHNVS